MTWAQINLFLFSGTNSKHLCHYYWIQSVSEPILISSGNQERSPQGYRTNFHSLHINHWNLESTTVQPRGSRGSWLEGCSIHSKTQPTQPSCWGRWQEDSLLWLLSCSPGINSIELTLEKRPCEKRKRASEDDEPALLAWRAWGEGYHRPASPPPAGPCHRSLPLRCGSCHGWSLSCRSSACGGWHCQSSCLPAPCPGAWCLPRCPRCGNCCGWRWSDETGAYASCCLHCSRWPGTAFPAGPCQGPGCHWCKIPGTASSLCGKEHSSSLCSTKTEGAVGELKWVIRPR